VLLALLAISVVAGHAAPAETQLARRQEDGATLTPGGQSGPSAMRSLLLSDASQTQARQSPPQPRRVA
jgi:hypothetical protein